MFEFKLLTHQQQKILLLLFTFLLKLLAAAFMKPWHLELRALKTHSTIELHEAQSGPHIECIWYSWKM